VIGGRLITGAVSGPNPGWRHSDRLRLFPRPPPKTGHAGWWVPLHGVLPTCRGAGRHLFRFKAVAPLAAAPNADTRPAGLFPSALLTRHAGLHWGM